VPCVPFFLAALLCLSPCNDLFPMTRFQFPVLQSDGTPSNIKPEDIGHYILVKLIVN
jgi:hypothetical protein